MFWAATLEEVIPYGLYAWHSTTACLIVSLPWQLPGHKVTLGQRASMAGQDQLHPTTQGSRNPGLAHQPPAPRLLEQQRDADVMLPGFGLEQTAASPAGSSLTPEPRCELAGCLFLCWEIQKGRKSTSQSQPRLLSDSSACFYPAANSVPVLQRK